MMKVARITAEVAMMVGIPIMSIKNQIRKIFRREMKILVQV